MKKIGMYSLLSALLGSAISCTPALPPEEPDDLYRDALHATRLAARETEDYARLCRLEVAKSEVLVSEARELLAQAKVYRDECQAMIKRIPRRVVKKTPKKESPKKEATTSKTTTQAAPTSNEEGPLYSPSDAP